MGYLNLFVDIKFEVYMTAYFNLKVHFNLLIDMPFSPNFRWEFFRLMANARLGSRQVSQ